MLSKTITLILLLLASANAGADFIGTANGVFTSAGPSCSGPTICTGVPGPFIRYGNPFSGPGGTVSTLQFLGESIEVPPDPSTTSTGSLSWFNGITALGSEITQFTLQVNYDGSPSRAPLVFGFLLNTRENVGTDINQQDTITLATIGGLTVLETQMFLQGAGIDKNSFNLLENVGHPVSVQLLAQFSEPIFAGFGEISDPDVAFLSQVDLIPRPPTSVSEPSVSALLFSGLLGLILVRRRQKRLN